jgi:hypothetical protein
MEWINSDIPGDESPHCSCCGRQIGTGVDAIAIRVGSIRGEGKRFDFFPKQFDDKEDLKWFHFSCLETLFDFAESENKNEITECAFCPEDVLGSPECYEFELGQFEIRGRDTWWMEERTLEGDYIRISVCKTCVELSIGDGDTAEMRRRLGKEPLPNDEKKWINYDEIPKSMLEEKEHETLVPPHLRNKGRRPPSARR